MQTLNQTVCENGNLHGIIDDLYNHIKNDKSEFQERESVWSLIEKVHLEVNINKFEPI